MSIKTIALVLREDLLSAVRAVGGDAESVLAEIEEHVGGVLTVIRNEVAFIVTGEKGGEYVAPAQPSADDLAALKKHLDDPTTAAEASAQQIAALEAQNASLTEELSSLRAAQPVPADGPAPQPASDEATPPASQTSDEQAGEATTAEPAQG